MISFRASSPFILSTLLVLFASGCVVFRPVGDVIGGGYKNTVAYFNSYYNAKNIFDEAEGEILANEEVIRARDGITDSPIPIPQTSRTKLTTVIDKCSNILSFHTESAFVDDAVFLIGKSYFYQGENLKAERKFTELLALSLSDELELEAMLWYARTLERLNRDADAVAEAERLIERSLAEGEESIAGHAFDVVGNVHSKAGEDALAAEAYRNAARYCEDETVRGIAQFRLGQELMQMGSFTEAAEAFLTVTDVSEEEGLLRSSILAAIEAFRKAEEYDRALEVCTEAKDDYRLVNSILNIEYEEALTLLEKGQTEDAVRLLTVIDTTVARTTLGSRAAFALAKLYEARGEFQKAHEAYTRAAAYPVPDIYTTVLARGRAFGRYLTLAYERFRRDSILMQMDKGIVDSSFSDRAADSLRALQAENSYELAEVFYADLQFPDSAGQWYRTALRTMKDTTKTPRILFILAEMRQSSSDEADSSPEQLYERIIEEYPKSLYAMRARVKLGLEAESSFVDSAGFVYQRAERTIEDGEYERAISQLTSIVNKYPLSPFAAQSAYAVGWLYEYRLGKPDSALAHYNDLIQHFSDTPYASLLRKRLKPPSAAPADSVRGELERREIGKEKTPRTEEAAKATPAEKVIE